ncbi:hypothetical protein MRX96_006533 [Rhipicephalus microplus]
MAMLANISCAESFAHYAPKPAETWLACASLNGAPLSGEDGVGFLRALFLHQSRSVVGWGEPRRGAARLPVASLGETGHPRASSGRIDVAFRRDIRWDEPYQVRLSASSSLLDGATEEVRDDEAGKRREKVISIEGPWRPDRGRHTRTHVDGQTRIVDARAWADILSLDLLAFPA